MDPKIVGEMLHEARELLRLESWKTEEQRDAYLKQLDEAFKEVDFTHSGEGIGIYASNEYVRIVRFPFPVEKTILVSDRFSCRELMYYRNFIREYYVLSLEKKQLHLYHGKDRHIEELHNADFPLILDNDYEYTKPSPVGLPGSFGVKSFERDKSIILEIRLIDLMKEADRKLDGYFEKLPVLLAGGEKEIGEYLQITKHKKEFFAQIRGIYPAEEKNKLGEVCRESIRERRRKDQHYLVDDLRELFGRELLTSGLEQVWKAGFEGKGLELFVETNFRQRAWISPDRYYLNSRNIPGKNYDHCADAVEETIRVIAEKNGKITFVDDGILEEFDRIALRLRYA